MSRASPGAIVRPMFPLGSVLLPGQVLPLHVFEPRYRVLVFDVERSDPAEFGVVLIERGPEVGGGDVRSSTGCLARLVERSEAPDGRRLLVAVGTDRFRVAEWLPEDPYPVARITVDPPPEAPLALDLDEVTAAARSLGALACELGAPPWPAELELSEDAVHRMWQLALLCPLGTLDRQRLLECDDPVERRDLLAAQVAGQREVLEARLEWEGGTGP